MDGSRAGHIMPIELTVVGEDETDRQWLLVQGSDGRCYKYHPRRRRLVPVEPDDWWVRNSDVQPREDEPAAGGTTWTG
jgi:hypothetical protein